ncbi:MAG TPA: YdeI/OmpD-associated family protein [Pyrinomonadaceae bacterium]|nr:YdeI/OmpD-associated family protein [Pyrinomonadaceae bacterium]
MEIKFFKTHGDFRKWLEKHHATERELWVGYYKKDSGRQSMTWPESVDEALCFGWIDGIRKSVDEMSYKIRFTPRRARSIWSAVNIKRVEELAREGRMRPAGEKAFAARTENRSGIYAYEQRQTELVEPYGEKLRRNRTAWKFFEAQTASYRKAASWWVLSAKREETRLKRLQTLIEDSAAGRTLAQYTRTKKSD